MTEHLENAMKKLSILFAIPVLLLVGSCGSDEDPAAPPDTTPPVVTSVSPADGATDVDTMTTVSATFSEDLDVDSVGGSTFMLSGVSGAITIFGAVARILPVSPLAPNTTYTATVTTGIKDKAGNPLASDFSWSFTTEARSAPPPGSPPARH